MIQPKNKQYTDTTNNNNTYDMVDKIFPETKLSFGAESHREYNTVLKTNNMLPKQVKLK